MNSGHRCSNESQKTTLGSQGTYLKTSKVKAQKRVNLLFLRGCWRGEMMTMMLIMRWEPLCRHRTVQQQHLILKNLFSGLSIYSSPLMSAVRSLRCGVGGQEIDGQQDTFKWSQLGSQLPARPPYSKIGFTIIAIILWLEKINKSRFLFLPMIQLL
jgi:hypothetical protein